MGILWSRASEWFSVALFSETESEVAVGLDSLEMYCVLLSTS